MARLYRKHDLDVIVANVTGQEDRHVHRITTAFLTAVMDALVGQDEVQLDGFGRFRLVVEKAQDRVTELTSPDFKKTGVKKKTRMRIKRKFRVHFSKSDVFNAILRKKYGPNVTKEKRGGGQ